MKLSRIRSCACLKKSWLLHGQTASSQPVIFIGAPGFVDECRGIMLEAENLEVKNLLLIPSIQDALQIPICLFHDVRSATVGRPITVQALPAGFCFSESWYRCCRRSLPGRKDLCRRRNKAGEIGHTAAGRSERGNPATWKTVWKCWFQAPPWLPEPLKH